MSVVSFVEDLVIVVWIQIGVSFNDMALEFVVRDKRGLGGMLLRQKEGLG